MKFIIFILGLLFFGCNGNSDKNSDIDSSLIVDKANYTHTSLVSKINEFEKFSYLLIFMNDKDTAGNATGFFIKRCGHLYLISNFHVLADRHYNDLTPLDFRYNHILIRYRNKDNNDWIFYDLDLNKRVFYLTDSLKRKMPVDIFYVEITELSENLIYTIENNSSLTDSNIQKGSTAFFCGYPGYDHDKTKGFKNQLPNIVQTKIIEYNKDNLDGKNNAFILESPMAKGFSGSPTFAYTINKNDSSIKFSFLGIMYASLGESQNKMHGSGFRDDIIYKLLPPCK